MLFFKYVFRSFPALPPLIQSRLLDILERSVRAASALLKKDAGDDTNDDLDSSRTRSNALKMSTFLLFTVISSAESAHVAGKSSEGPKKKGKKASQDDDDEKFDWAAHRESAVSSFASVLETDMSKLWTMGVPDEKFINLFCRTAYQLLEQPITGRGTADLKQIIVNLIAVPLRIVTSLEAAVVDRVNHLLHNHEHSIPTMALLCKAASTVSGDTRLATAVLREVAHIDLASAGVKNIAAFISEVISWTFPPHAVS
jgi:hypothetical protein